MLVPDFLRTVKQKSQKLAMKIILKRRSNEPHLSKFVITLKVRNCAVRTFEQIVFESIHKIKHFFTILYELLF